MDALTAVATQHGLDLLNSTLKNTATRYALIGAETHDATATGTFHIGGIETSYYDSNGVLTFVVELPNETDFGNYLSAIAILDTNDQIVINTPTPKIALARGIGGMVTIKAAVTGEPGEVVFKASDYVTESELRDNWLVSATDSQRGLMRMATPAEAEAGEARDVAISPAQLAGVNSIPSGTVLYFAAEEPPSGWLECDGAALSRSTYADLFSVIGTVFGTGDDATTFNLPDARGDFVRGWDHGRGVDSGRALGSSQQATHIRTLIDNYAGYSYGTFSVGAWEIDGPMSVTVTGSTTRTTLNNTQYYTASAGVNVGSGDNVGFAVRPRNVAMMYCIKY